MDFETVAVELDTIIEKKRDMLFQEYAQYPLPQHMERFQEETMSEHLLSLCDRLILSHYKDEGQANRLLGYIQGVLVTRNLLTVEECKEMNRRSI